MTARGALLAAFALVGCKPVSDPLNTPTAVLRVFVRGEDGRYVARPEADFFVGPGTDFPDSRAAFDTCGVANLNTISVGPPRNLDAGDSVAFTTGGRTVYLHPTLDVVGVEHYLPAGEPVEMTPGGAATFEIPGAAEFPAATLTGLTPPAITSLSAIPASPPADQPLTVTWEPTGDDSSRFEVALLYATEGAIEVNQQVLCQWRDDGSGTIRGTLLTGWTGATIQRIEVSRYRTLQQNQGGNLLYFLATFDTLPPVTF